MSYKELQLLRGDGEARQVYFDGADLYLRMCTSARPLHTPLGGCRRSSREGEGPLGAFDWGIIICARTLQPGLDGDECLPDFTEGRSVICLVRYAPLAEPVQKVCSLRPCPMHGAMCMEAYSLTSNQVKLSNNCNSAGSKHLGSLRPLLCSRTRA